MSSSSSSSNQSHTETNPTMLEKCGYTVNGKLGTGSFSKVMKAFSKERDKNVALKIIQKNRLSQLFLNHFLPREIELVKGLVHPNILKYYQCIETTRRVIIVMEFAENGTLLNFVSRSGRLSEPDARNYFHQLVEAVKYCHSKNIAHRDLKLENLMLTTDNCLKLGDFGFARKFKPPVELSRTYCGSNSYASPEILKQTPYDPMGADVWAMGVILFTLVYGQLPYDDSSIAQLIQQVNHGPDFPKDIEVSTKCKNLMRALMSPLENRLDVIKINLEPWMSIDSETENITNNTDSIT